MNYLNVLLIVIFFACFASLLNGGLWGNALALFNTVTAGLLASNYWEPVANFLTSKAPSYAYFMDFLAFWMVFAVAFIVFRAITDAVSRVKVRFKKPVEMGGGIFFALWVSWVMVCLTTMSLHMAPLSRNFLYGAFQPEPESEMFFGLAPDRQWLGFVHKVSTGAFSRGGTPENPFPHEFDPYGQFILKYARRRAEIQAMPAFRIN